MRTLFQRLQSPGQLGNHLIEVASCYPPYVLTVPVDNGEKAREVINDDCRISQAFRVIVGDEVFCQATHDLQNCACISKAEHSNNCPFIRGRAVPLMGTDTH